jgi:DNA repair protein RadC
VYPSCRSHHRAGRAIETAEDAIRTLRIATEDGRLDCMVLACVDADREPLTMFVFDGPGRLEDDVEVAVDAVLGAVADADSPLSAIFLGSSRPAGEPGPTPEDERRWVRMADACADAGIDLLDWFLLCGPAACSVAEGLVPGPRW